MVLVGVQPSLMQVPPTWARSTRSVRCRPGQAPWTAARPPDRHRSRSRRISRADSLCLADVGEPAGFYGERRHRREGSSPPRYPHRRPTRDVHSRNPPHQRPPCTGSFPPPHGRAHRGSAPDRRIGADYRARLGELPQFGRASGAGAVPPGLALLHSFEYVDAAEAFREAQRVDSGFAMAYWGEALTYDHPIWERRLHGCAALARLGHRTEARAQRGNAGAGLLGAVEALYGRQLKERRRAPGGDGTHTGLLDRPRGASLRALALLSLRTGGKSDLRPSVQAAAIVEDVLRRNPTQPGAPRTI